MVLSWGPRGAAYFDFTPTDQRRGGGLWWRSASGMAGLCQCWRLVLCSWLVLLLLLPASLASSFDLYCSDRSCYETLQLTQGRDASAADIRRAFYRLSLVLHPDKAPANAAPHEAEQRADAFQRVVTAYEVLSDEASRAAYHSFLDNPALFSHHIRYYQHRVRAAQVSVWKVLAATTVIATGLHWLYIRHRYQHVRAALASHPTVQQRMAAKVKQDMQAELGRVDNRTDGAADGGGAAGRLCQRQGLRVETARPVVAAARRTGRLTAVAGSLAAVSAAVDSVARLAGSGVRRRRARVCHHAAHCE